MWLGDLPKDQGQFFVFGESTGYCVSLTTMLSILASIFPTKLHDIIDQKHANVNPLTLGDYVANLASGRLYSVNYWYR
jgi:hypothetical protein